MDRGEPKVTRLFVPAMDCPDEEREIRAALSRLPGVEGISFRLFARQVEVRHRGEAEEILAALSDLGMEGRPLDASLRKAALPEATRSRLAVFFVCAALAAAGGALHALAPGAPFARWPFLAAVVAGGGPVARRGIRELRNRSLGMNALMTVSIAGTALLGEWAEGAVVVTLFALANWLEARTLDRARRATASLFEESPETAVVRVGGPEGEERTVPAGEVRPGDILVVRPGERVPVDAVVFKGASEMNEAVLTGEAAPVPKGEGDPLYAGTVNGRGLLLARAARPLEESTLAAILRRVEEAQGRKAPVETFMERFAAVYTPAVLAAALLVAAIPPLAGAGSPGTWIYRALVLLVIACPCAIVLAAPVATVAALTRATRDGILVKGATHLEALARIRAVAFDKTGTLTRGRFRVTRVRALGGHDGDAVVRMAAAVEAGSSHPAAEAVRHEARRRGIARPARGTTARTFETIEGRGVGAEVDGRRVYVGNRRLFEEFGARLPGEADEPPAGPGGGARTVAYVGTREAVAGIVEMEDEVRPEAGAAVAALRAMGVGRVAMLTGDHAAAARTAAAAVGIGEVHAGLSPDGKLDLVRTLAAAHGGAAMVGDGINDAPALAAATVGIAMGAAGSPAAIETADVALVAEDLGRIPAAVALGRRMVAVVRQNVAAALLIKAAFLAAAAAGTATMWMAVAADMGTTLLVIGNGLRLLGGREPRGAP